MRDGDSLTISDGAGSWKSAVFSQSGALETVGETHQVPERTKPLTIAFSLVKGTKPELVIQKLTELGIDRIVVLRAARSVVKWDEDKVAKALGRWNRIIREAAMQSHRVRLPTIEAVVDAQDWLQAPEVSVAHFGGAPLTAEATSIAIGPEGGWDTSELDLVPRDSGRWVTLGDTVLRAETAAIAAGTLLSAATG